MQKESRYPAMVLGFPFGILMCLYLMPQIDPLQAYVYLWLGMACGSTYGITLVISFKVKENRLTFNLLNGVLGSYLGFIGGMIIKINLVHAIPSLAIFSAGYALGIFSGGFLVLCVVYWIKRIKKVLPR